MSATDFKGWSVANSWNQIRALSPNTPQNLNQGSIGNCLIHATADILFYKCTINILYEQQPTPHWRLYDNHSFLDSYQPTLCNICSTFITDIVLIDDSTNQKYHMNCFPAVNTSPISASDIVSPFITTTLGREEVCIGPLCYSCPTMMIQNVRDGMIYKIVWGFRLLAQNPSLDYLLNLTPTSYLIIVNGKSIVSTLPDDPHALVMTGIRDSGCVSSSNSWGAGDANGIPIQSHKVLELYDVFPIYVQKYKYFHFRMTELLPTFKYARAHDLYAHNKNVWRAQRGMYGLIVGGVVQSSELDQNKFGKEKINIFINSFKTFHNVTTPLDMLSLFTYAITRYIMHQSIRNNNDIVFFDLLETKTRSSGSTFSGFKTKLKKYGSNDTCQMMERICDGILIPLGLIKKWDKNIYVLDLAMNLPSVSLFYYTLNRTKCTPDDETLLQQFEECLSNLRSTVKHKQQRLNKLVAHGYYRRVLDDIPDQVFKFPIASYIELYYNKYSIYRQSELINTNLAIPSASLCFKDLSLKNTNGNNLSTKFQKYIQYLLASVPPVWILCALVIAAILYLIYHTATQVNGVMDSLNTTDDIIYQQIAMTFTFCCGIIFIILGVMRAGFVIVFLSGSIFAIVLSQCRPIFTEHLYGVITNIHTIRWYTTLISIVPLIILFIPKCTNRIPKWVPFALIVIVLNIIFSYIFDFESLGVAVVGNEVSAGFPMPIIPTFKYILFVFSSALMVTIVDYMSNISLPNSFQQKTKDTYQQHLSKYNTSKNINDKTLNLPPIDVNANMEFMVYGIVNLFDSMFSSQLISASFSRTVLNYEMNGQTRIASFFRVIIILFCLFFLMPFLSPLPKCVLASVVITAVYRLIKGGIIEFKCLYRVSKPELIEFIVSVIGMEMGVFLAIGTSIIADVLRHTFTKVIFLSELGNKNNQYVNVSRVLSLLFLLSFLSASLQYVLASVVITGVYRLRKCDLMEFKVYYKVSTFIISVILLIIDTEIGTFLTVIINILGYTFTKVIFLGEFKNKNNQFQYVNCKLFKRIN